jgi:hypothetical protein
MPVISRGTLATSISVNLPGLVPTEAGTRHSATRGSIVARHTPMGVCSWVALEKKVKRYTQMRRQMSLRLLALCLFASVSASVLVRKLVSQEPRPASFTATKVEHKYRPDGSPGRTEEFVEAFRGDGSSVSVRRAVMENGRLLEQRTVTDLSRGVEVFVDGLTESLSTAQIGDEKAHLLRFKHSRTDCADPSESPGTSAPQTNQRSTILGYDVILVQRNLPGPGKGQKSTIESWRAPALDCYPLRETYTWVGSDGRGPKNVREVTSIIVGEPDASLFQIPSGWTERSPSQTFQEFRRRYPAQGSHVNPESPQVVEMDKRYNDRRPN